MGSGKGLGGRGYGGKGATDRWITWNDFVVSIVVYSVPTLNSDAFIINIPKSKNR
jgi:hypothetical protein